MKRIALLTVAVLFAGSSLFAEGFSLHGHVRSGLSFGPTDGKVVKGTRWMGGDYIGGVSRVRLTATYEMNNGGVTARYQKAGSFSKDDWFDSGNIKFVMAYAKFLDGSLIAEAGKLGDNYTTTGGWEDGTFNDDVGVGNGVRLVYMPPVIEGLTVAASASDIFLDKYTDTDSEVVDGDAESGDKKFDEKLFGASAKYATDYFFVTGGVHLGKVYYGSFGLTAVKDLTFVVEAFVNDRGKDRGEGYGDDTNILICPWIEYSGIDRLTLGAYAYIENEEETTVTINPAVMFGLTEKVILGAEVAFYNISTDDDVDSYALITPSVTFAANDSTLFAVYADISTDTDQYQHAIGAGIKYTF